VPDRAYKTRNQTVNNRHRDGRNALHQNKPGKQNKSIPHPKLPDDPRNILPQIQPIIPSGNREAAANAPNRASQTHTPCQAGRHFRGPTLREFPQLFNDSF
jgi:hypothetical protein